MTTLISIILGCSSLLALAALLLSLRGRWVLALLCAAGAGAGLVVGLWARGGVS